MKKRFTCLALLLVLLACEQIAVETPDGFAALDTEDQYAAMSPEGMIYRVRIVENEPAQNLDFWSEALKNHLEQEGYVSVSAETTFAAGSIDGSYTEWTVPYGNETYKYLTAIVAAGETLAVVELSGRHDVYDGYRAAVSDSLETIRFEGVKAIDLGKQPIAVATPRVAKSEQRSEAPSGGCFLAGTPVLTSRGIVPIEAMWPGTPLPVYDPATGRWLERQVERTIALPYNAEVIRFEIAGKTVEVTAHHPLLVASGKRLDRRSLPGELSAPETLGSVTGRWVEARHLRPGDRLLSRDGRTVRVGALRSSFLSTTVYHLAINGPHTYAVEQPGIVVHNGGAEEGYKAPVESAQAAREREIIGGGAITASLPTDARSERVRVYSGACSLMIERAEPAKRRIADMAEQAGGYVEQSSDTRIVIRIPAVEFRGVFDDILALGEVLYKAIETYDVTDQFTDPSGRLAVAIRARDRLYVLLNRVEDPKERLEILKKIREYTETIERLELSLKVLQQRIAMSRITVELHSRLEEAETAERPIPFAWIDRLHPLYESTGPLGGKATVTLPADVAVFDQAGVLRAEAADGTRIRIGTVKNDPRGDSLFWQRALVFHLKARYKATEEVAEGPLSLVLFTSKDREPYYYLVGALPLAEEATLVVFEVYFPDRQSLERHFENAVDAFTQAGTE